MMDVLPLHEVLGKVLSGSGECAKVTWQFLGLKMPTWVLMNLAGLALLGCSGTGAALSVPRPASRPLPRRRDQVGLAGQVRGSRRPIRGRPAELGKADTRSRGRRRIERLTRQRLSAFSATAEKVARRTQRHRAPSQAKVRVAVLLAARSAHPHLTLSATVPDRLRAPCGSSGVHRWRYCRRSFPPDEPLRRRDAERSIPAFPRARVCLSKLGERHGSAASTIECPCFRS